MMIHWCELCNERAAEGLLTIIRTGETEPVNVMACQKCVSDIPPQDWIDHNDMC